MIKVDLIPCPIGTPESAVSMVCIHEALYTYKRRKLKLTLMEHTEEIAVGLPETLPCPMLLGVN